MSSKRRYPQRQLLPFSSLLWESILPECGCNITLNPTHYHLLSQYYLLPTLTPIYIMDRSPSINLCGRHQNNRNEFSVHAGSWNSETLPKAHPREEPFALSSLWWWQIFLELRL